ncbi:MAG TPA: non-canonical purine NTP diphosphatase [Bacteroidales bacterium]|jgi:XTP/dITP diphosphohydrolase|nr:non-canonical purine NTP diphosphatase [Bacteroidales bacterium]HRS17870.1 non-canonical purine NTP diphosphatase [Bacteroidales bacterium]
MKLVFATNNKHKLQEIRAIAGKFFEIISLEELGCSDEIPETGETLEDNAIQKATYIYEKYGHNCFADDTGLEIEALDWAPGVITARFAGEHCSPDDNIRKTLELMEGKTNRYAIFRTVIACIIDGEEYLFEGAVEGTIATQRMGEQGFGYDPIFIPAGYETSFAQMPMSIKNTISHRGRATAEFMKFLHEISL